jgi:hypothetical protein
MFGWLENTELALWVGGSLWAYPTLLSLHITGLAIVVGIFSVRDLRLMGLFPGLDLLAFLSLSKLAWAGFALNAVSGILLFTSQASIFIANTAFLIKIACIATSMILAFFIQSRLRLASAPVSKAFAITLSTKLLAFESLCLWLAAIIAGRLIAYV